MVLSGVATVAFEDGRVIELTPGSLFYVPPVPHDSWVVGGEPYVSLHFLGAQEYARKERQEDRWPGGTEDEGDRRERREVRGASRIAAPDCRALVKMLERVTKAKAKMWGRASSASATTTTSTRAAGNDWFMAGFSPRKKEFVCTSWAACHREPALKKLGKHKTGKAACTSAARRRGHEGARGDRARRPDLRSGQWRAARCVRRADRAGGPGAVGRRGAGPGRCRAPSAAAGARPRPDDYETAWRARDAAALARLFAEDGFVLSSGQLPVRGRAAIEQHYAGSGGRSPARVRVRDGGRRATSSAATHRTAGADTGSSRSRSSKDANGRWLIFSDMDNGNAAVRTAS